MAKNTLNCPNCGAEIDVSEVLYHDIGEELKRKYEKDKADRDIEINKRLKEIEAKEISVMERSAEISGNLAKMKDELQLKFDKDRNKMESELKAKISELTDREKAVAERNAEIDSNLKKMKDELQLKFDKEREQKDSELNNQLKELEDRKTAFESTVREQVDNRLVTEKKRIEEDIKKRINDENSEILAEKEREILEKTEQVKELNRTKAENERLKREKDEIREKLELENEQKYTEMLREAKGNIKKSVEEEQLLKLKERDKLIDDLKAQLGEAQRRAEQGSVQLQGEIQELELEAILRNLFPWDEIAEVKKGQRGADCLQTVRNTIGMDCGKIYYESKRTKDFQNGWIQKLKDDNLDVKADILIIVTQAMPDGDEKYFYKDGVWICSFNEIKPFSILSRHYLLQMQSLSVTQQNKGSKMEALYNYLTSQEFRGQFEAIMDGFSSLQSGYSDEKKKMLKIWAEREKQLDKILTNTINFYGSLKGIAGAAIPNITMLEDGQDRLAE